jgi:methanogenic corrinoid protein MtbC1
MITELILERYLDALLKGDRVKARSVIEETLQTGTPVNSVYIDVIWPIMVEIEKLTRADKITPIQDHLAVRINRTIVDQLQNKLPRKSIRDKKVVICCAPDEIQELGAQMLADLFESDGWEVKFLGGGLTNEDILTYVNEYSPDTLVIYGTTPKQAPSIRKLIDKIKEINACPNMAIMVSGGLYNRAKGLWEEIGADLFAPTAVEAIQTASDFNPEQNTTQRTIKCRSQKQSSTKENT